MKPPRYIPESLTDQYTLNDKIRLIHSWVDGTCDTPKTYSLEMIEKYLEKAKKRELSYYGETDIYLYQALEKYKIKDKSVAIIGSNDPWYEAVCIAYGGYPTIIEYNKIISEHPKIKAMTVSEYDINPILFDMAFSISSFEHDGLGRYGDPINPNGDLIAMNNAKKMLKKDGILFLAVPVGLDTVVWNKHRVYGEIRLPLLLGGWECINSFGFDKAHLLEDLPYGQEPAKDRWQPVFVLKPYTN